MSRTITEPLKSLDQWGIPDWKDPSTYPDIEKTPKTVWKWEFLRRREDYRDDWLTYAPLTYQQKLGENKTKKKNQGPKCLVTPEDPNFLAEMPDSQEKYKLALLPNPVNPWPENFSFTNEPDVFLRYGHGEIEDLWGLQYSLFPGETAISIDLTQQPVEAILSQYKEGVGFDHDFEEKIAIPEKVRKRKKTSVSGVDLLMYAGNVYPPRKRRNKGGNAPRFFLDPRQDATVHVIFSQGEGSLLAQWRTAKQQLKTLQQTLVEKLPSTSRLHPDVWQNYLRVLDARSIRNDAGKRMITYAEIGWKIFHVNKTKRFKANSRGSQAYLDAIKLQNAIPF